MAHSCPICCQTCYCGGDIDDCVFDFDKYYFACTHCPEDDEYEEQYEPEGTENESSTT